VADQKVPAQKYHLGQELKIALDAFGGAEDWDAPVWVVGVHFDTTADRVTYDVADKWPALPVDIAFGVEEAKLAPSVG
jgi:hypothetical protein